MPSTSRALIRAILITLLAAIIASTSTRLRADSGTCNGRPISVPFTDVAGNLFFCQIAESYLCGLTYGTDATHYSPSEVVPREQMAAFITRTEESILKRGSLRAALNMWATPKTVGSGAMTGVGCRPERVASDGRDIWVANFAYSQCGNGTVSRVRASDGKGLQTWTAPTELEAVLVARGYVYVTGGTPGNVYRFDPKQPPGNVSVLASGIGSLPLAITTDGFYIWTANFDSVSKVSPDGSSVQKFTAGFTEPDGGILYDGNNIWVVDAGANKLRQLNSNGSIAMSVDIGDFAGQPVFDGRNIWVPSGLQGSEKVTIVRASSGAVIAKLHGNGLNRPYCAAFDGERILITNYGGDSISLWQATSFAPLGSVATGTGTSPFGACSDGINFWVALYGSNQLLRF